MINVGIIGCGGVALTRHIPGILSIPHKACLYGVTDLNAEQAKKIASQYDCKFYSDMAEMFADDQIDAVVVCTPAKSHCSITVEALNHNKHVLCEKPMAVSEEDAKKMIEAEKLSGKKLMISHNQRFYEPHSMAKKLLDSGVIGKLISFRTCLGIKGPEYSSVLGLNNAYFSKKLSGRGVMSDVGSHRIDLMHYFVGSSYKRVFSYTPTLAKRDSEGKLIELDDNAFTIAEMENGVVGSIINSWTSMSGNDRSTMLFGSEGVITIYSADASLKIEMKNGDIVEYKFPTDCSQDVVLITDIDEKFIDCIIHNSKPLVTSLDGLEVIRTLDAMELSNKTGKWEIVHS